MKQAPNDHARWGEAALPVKAAAERLLSSARGYDPGVRVTLAEIEAAVRTERRRAASGLPARLLAAVAAGLVLVTGGVALSRGWLALRDPVKPSVTSERAKAAGGVERRRRLRSSLSGSAAAEAPRRLDGEVAPPPGDSAAAGPRTSPPIIDQRLPEVPSPVRAPVRATVPSRPAERPRRPHPEPAGARVEAGPSQAPVRPNAAPAARPPVSSSTSPVTGSPGLVPPVRALASTPLGSGIVPPAFEVAPLGSPAGAETSQIRDALVQLRRERNPAGALDLLDAYDARFPVGLWRDEAAVIRIEALLALGRSREALERCEAISRAALDRSPGLRVTRGELRVRYGRCDEAQADFSAVLGLPVGDEVRARALRGRAACRNGLGARSGL